jgi:hypothetical protein
MAAVTIGMIGSRPSFTQETPSESSAVSIITAVATKMPNFQ